MATDREACPTCNRLISTDAAVCPKCGQPLDAAAWEAGRAKRRRKAKIAGSVFAAIAALLVLPAIVSAIRSRPTSEVIYRTEYGKGWPFSKFDSGVLACDERPGMSMIIVTLGGVSYGINGTAIGRGGYPDAEAVMGRLAGDVLELGDLHDIIQRGHRLCPGRP